MLTRSICFGLSLSLLIGCGGGFGNSGLIDLTSGAASPLAKLQGNWFIYRPCAPEDAIDEVQSVSRRFLISGNSFTVSVILYSDANCLSEFIRWESLSTFVIGAELEDIGGNMIDFTRASSTITPMTELATQHMKNTAVCGDTSGWFTGSARIISAGQSCVLVPGHSVSVSDSSVAFMLLKVDRSVSPQRLYLGDTSGGKDGLTIEKRPTSYSKNFYLMKDLTQEMISPSAWTGIKNLSSMEVQQAIQGTWLGPCNAGFRWKYAFSGMTITQTSYEYNDADCALGVKQERTTEFLDIIIEGPSSNQDDGYDITLPMSINRYSIIKVSGSKLAFGYRSSIYDGTTVEKRARRWDFSTYFKQ